MAKRGFIGSALIFIPIIVVFFNTPLIVANVDATSLVGNFTLEERQAIQKVRSLVEAELYQSYMKTDGYLIRWIRDQNLDMGKATKKLQASLKWRKVNNIDGSKNEDFSDIFKVCPYTLDGRDKSGRPMITLAIGPCPIRRLILSGKGRKFVRYVYGAFEKATELVEQIQAQGYPISDLVAILDLNGFNWKDHACLQCIPIEIEVITAYEHHYPRYFHSFFVINAPRIFENLVTVIWPILSEHSRRILHIYGFDKNEWQRVLLKGIPVEQLTPQYGGTKGINRKQ